MAPFLPHFKSAVKLYDGEEDRLANIVSYNPDIGRAHLSDGSDKSSRSQERGDDGLPVRIQVICPIGTLFTEPFDEIGHGET